MKITILLDVSHTFERVLDKILEQGGSTAILNKLEEMMGAIDNLKTAVDNDIAASQAGFEAIGSAMQELADDIQKLPQAADVQAEADRLSTNAQTITDAFTSASQAIRDALPTEPTA